jgi:UDP-2,3-diacylglucosamine pyrophosphatase LpxH
MKKPIATIPAIFGVVLITAFLSWAFSLHGTIGLYRVNGLFHWAFLLLGFTGLVLLLLALLFQWLKSSGLQWLMVLTIIISLPAIIVPPVAFYYTSGIFSSRIGDTPPQVLMADGTGAFNVPNMAVVFNTEATTRNTLAWGLGDTTTKLEESKTSNRHVFMLRDLKPDSMYMYRVNEGPISSFSTPSVDGSLHFAVASDAHFGAILARNDFTAKMLDEIAAPSNDFNMVFFLGDLVEYGFQRNQWQQAFQIMSRTASVIPTRFAAGNHDTLFSGFSNYQNNSYPAGMDEQSGSRLWYRIDTGRVHFLILDIEWSTESYTFAQAAWLEAQLKSIPADDWKIVMSHGFYYASGVEIEGWKWYDNPETIGKLTPLFNKYGVDLVFSGHNHRLELLQNSGVVYAVCAPFGGLPDPAPTYVSPSSIWDGTGEYGFIEVTINGEKCILTFRNQKYEVLKIYSFKNT